MKRKTARLLIMLLCASGALSGCNGGGDGGTPAAGPTTAAVDNPPAANGNLQQNGANGAFSGKLFYEYTGYTTLDLATGAKRPYLPLTTDRFSFSISSDGQKAYVAEQLTFGDIDRGEGTHRYIVVSTHNGQQIDTFPGSPGSLSGMAMNLSPDGQRIATGLLRNGWNGDAHLVVENRHGEVLFDFTEAGYTGAFGWLPDGRMVATDADGWLTLIDRNFNPVRRIRQFSGPGRPGRMQASPDGQRLVFNWNQRIYVMNIDGSNLHQVATSDLWESDVAWSPDSRWLVLAHGESTCPQLTIVNADESMVDVSYATRDPRAHQVQAATGYQGKLEPVCGRSVSWR
jgi:dipeptidyl aminopeptidase/acylaminoacyl peptidase